MAYCRWSSPREDIKGLCPECGIDWTPVDQTADFIKDLGPTQRIASTMRHWVQQSEYAHKNGGFCKTCTSDWYIYWDYTNTLAVWCTKAEDYPMYSPDEVRRILEAKSFDEIPGFKECGDQGLVESCMQAFIEEWDENQRS